jgi:DNA helicase-2/ATP-dependent DNA helicase PcrA
MSQFAIPDLNPQQLEAVTAPPGPVLIVAGPGSGKTRVLTARIAYAISQLGVPPWKIMAVTFTNKAAREMKERLQLLVGQQAEKATVGTFHAIGAGILRRYSQAIGLNPHFAIYDEADQLAVVRHAIADLGLDEKRLSPRAVLSNISRAKVQYLTPDRLRFRSTTPWQWRLAQIYERYEQLLLQNNALDFDDLLMKCIQLFEASPSTLEQLHERYLHVFVDEYQDTDHLQYLFLKHIAAKYRNITVVGDPDQSIFRWRQADIRNILTFREDYPDARVFKLEENYRSTKKILDAALAVIRTNRMRIDKGLWTRNPEGPPICLFEASDERDEAEFVASQISRLLTQKQFRPGDIAVMYRVNAQSRALEEAFLRYGLRYQLVGAIRFYERREIKDVIAFLRVIDNPADSLSLERVVTNTPIGQGIGQRTWENVLRWSQTAGIPVLEACRQLAEAPPRGLAGRTRNSLRAAVELFEHLTSLARTIALPELIDRAVDLSGYKDWLRDGTEEGEERWENVLELRTAAHEYAHLPASEGLSLFLQNLSLTADVDNIKDGGEACLMMTLHSAKGLEFPVVFIVGLEEGMLPHSRSLDDPEELEEERRLFYVGITRAKRLLYLAYAARRTIYGFTEPSVPSRFLADIPKDLLEQPSELQCGGRSPKGWHTEATDSASLKFRPGDRVTHHVFGEGTVTGTRIVNGDEEVTVRFPGKGEKVLLARYANLVRIGPSGNRII